KAVRIVREKSALIPIHYEIMDGATLTPCENDEPVLVPFSMISSVAEALVIRVRGVSLRDSFITSGDILVLRESAEPEEGNIVLALVSNKVKIGRWGVSGRSARIESLDANYKSTT